MRKIYFLLPILVLGACSKTSAEPIFNPDGLEKAVFAGGCFWSTQKAFDHVAGVVRTRAGFMGGNVENPSYDDVSSQTTGHKEAVEVFYDPKKVSFNQLLDTYWHSTDPTNEHGVICDFGPEYRTAIFTYSDEQLQQANQSKEETQKQLSKPIVTEIVASSSVKLPFFAAEEYHQHYWKTNSFAYNSYRVGCGRDNALKKIWGDKAPH